MYDNEEEAHEALMEKLKKEIIDMRAKIIDTKVRLKELEKQELEIKNLLEDE